MSRAPTLTLHDEVDVPLRPERVAAFVLDWRNDPLWRADVVSFTADPDGPAATGQHLVEVLRLAGLRFRTPTRIDTREPLAASWSGGAGGLRVAGRRTVTPLGAGSRVLVDVEIGASGPMRPVLAALAPVYRRRATADVARIPGLLV